MFDQLKYALRRARLPRESVSAVHDDDLTRFLTSIGALNDIRAGKIRCKFCSEQTSLDDLQAVIPDSGTISYICKKPQCVRDLMKYMEDANGQ